MVLSYFEGCVTIFLLFKKVNVCVSTRVSILAFGLAKGQLIICIKFKKNQKLKENVERFIYTDICSLFSLDVCTKLTCPL